MNPFKVLWKIVYTPTPKDPIKPKTTVQQPKTEKDLQMLVKIALEGEGSIYTGERSYAARELGKLGEAAKEVVPMFIEALKSKNAVIRENAADALGELGSVAIDAVPVLAKLLGDRFDKDLNKKVRISAAFALERIGLAKREDIKLISNAVRYDTAIVRYHAKRALEEIKDNDSAAENQIEEFKRVIEVPQTKSNPPTILDQLDEILNKIFQTRPDFEKRFEEVGALDPADPKTREQRHELYGDLIKAFPEVEQFLEGNIRFAVEVVEPDGSICLETIEPDIDIKAV
ncbi:MAG: hypothetical protein A3I68_08950 [Candidatus Melainabacteria bacterium RIFCSPLOWO2_02_FULL_35_15]|nr:MAG: hypothetical protein A3F80_05775 [Candidatus Melainabacteria bacterium RIFCSPLOWO2_12_FULL_35_11]OGI13911.1 MAG: hypothetical protein A3I68_08950 [Candidatus Melainabacteria bacterium RIFCSPLOWO2_02_FULL_35_15]